MPTGLTAPAPVALQPREKRRRFISAYWLRPENAFWTVLRSDALARIKMESPILDLSCGDGVFSFLHAGGRLAPEFDVFTHVNPRVGSALPQDDLFDYVDDKYDPQVAGQADYRIDYGVDWKPSLLAKASRLDFYGSLLRHDNNDPLPFEDHSFTTVYCNAAYWVEGIETLLAELRRVTAPNGSIVLQVKLDTIAQYTLQKHRTRLGDRWLELIDRGRLASWPTLCDRSTWERRFETAGLDVREAYPFATGTHAHVWDVGLRPVAPLLTKAMNSIHAHLRQEIKRDWVELFCDLLDPFCQTDLDLFAEPGEPAEVQYELTPRL